jgi:hypothetical protein
MYIVDEPGGSYGTYRGSFFNMSWAVGMPLTGTYCLASEFPARFDSDSPATISDVALNTEGSGAGVTGGPSAVWVPGAPDCSAQDVEVQTYILAPESSARALAWHVSFTVDIYQEG